MYRPNFCADCGERIRRARWLPWTSRRFCPKCATRLRQATRVVPLAGVLAITCAAWIVGRESSPAPPPLVIERGAFATNTPKTSTEIIAANNITGDAATPSSSASAFVPRAASAPIEDPNEVVSICGARTKKGSPCSRRVRGTGRCFQHKGKGAILSPGRLVVKA